eukprot:gene1711-biopygen22875
MTGNESGRGPLLNGAVEGNSDHSPRRMYVASRRIAPVTSVCRASPTHFDVKSRQMRCIALRRVVSNCELQRL